MSCSLTPVGVFWDIENCRVPKYKSALLIVQRIREKFYSGHCEAEFVCVCDINKENQDVIQELNSAQINVIHINAVSKNAADDKLRQSIRRFADTHSPPTTIILITSDINFAPDLSDLRHRRGFHIVLIHHSHIHDALLACANEHYVFEELMAEIPYKPPYKVPNASAEGEVDIIVTDIPAHIDCMKIKKRLQLLTSNCGGRVTNVNVSKGQAVVQFKNLASALKAEKRIAGEDVFGKKIKVQVNAPTEKKDNKKPKSRNRKSVHPSKPLYVPPKQKAEEKEKTEPVKLLKQAQYTSPKSSLKTKESKTTGCRKRQSVSCDPTSHSDSTKIRNRHHSSSPIQQSVKQEPPENKSPETVRSLFKKVSPTDQRTPRYTTDQFCKTEEMHVSYRPISHIPHTDDYFKHFPPDPVSIDPNIEIDDQTMHEIPQTKLRQVVNKFSQDKKTSREVLMLQQQLYQEDQNMLNDQDFPTGVKNATMKSQLPNCDAYESVHLHNINPQSHSSRFRSSPNFYQNGPQYELEPPQYGRNIFQPINNPSPWMCSPAHSPTPDDDVDLIMEDGPCPVELVVSNLDYNISAREWRKILFTTFHPQVKVLNVHIKAQPDNTSIGMIKVPSIEEARFAISQFHRKKIGYKRIHVTLKHEDLSSMSSIRSEAVALLSKAQDNVLPLFKFIELFDKRYHRSISVSELYKMRDIIDIREHGGAGRMVYLLDSFKIPTPESTPEPEVEEMTECPVCEVHCPDGSLQYADAMNRSMLPYVSIQLKAFAATLHKLLQSHNGDMPLMSFVSCYESEFSPLTPVTNGGVPLEHLISCVPGIQIQVSKCGVKKVKWIENKPPPVAEFTKTNSSPLLTQQLNQISREVVDLLKHQPQCRMPFTKFIPAYHHLFGRQCRVADYGYTKLMELFDAIPHVLQVLGTGERKVLTLSHRMQVKRFTADIIKLLKLQSGKEIGLDEFDDQFEKVHRKKFDITEYGVCCLEDMLMDIPSSTILSITEGNETRICIPRRDQTAEEMDRTRQFSLEVVDLLKHNPYCRMPFNKFIPAYHHHFGKQCKVAEYGFTKLVDLFEAIPHVVEVDFIDGFLYAVLRDAEEIPLLARQVLQLLMDQSGGSLPLVELCIRYKSSFGKDCNISKIREDLADYVQVIGDDAAAIITLTPLQSFARDVRKLLKRRGSIPVQQFEAIYLENYSIEVKPALYGYTSVLELLQAVPHIVSIKGLPELEYIQLAEDPTGTLTLRESPQLTRVKSTTPDSGVVDSQVEDDIPEIKKKSSDILSKPVPSNIPSPELHPKNSKLQPGDLIKFELNAGNTEVWSITEEEKKQLKTPLCLTPTSDLLQFAAQCLHIPCSTPPKTQASDEVSRESNSSSKDRNSPSSSEELLNILKVGWWKPSDSQIEELTKGIASCRSDLPAEESAVMTERDMSIDISKDLLPPHQTQNRQSQIVKQMVTSQCKHDQSFGESVHSDRISQMAGYAEKSTEITSIEVLERAEPTEGKKPEKPDPIALLNPFWKFRKIDFLQGKKPSLLQDSDTSSEDHSFDQKHEGPVFIGVSDSGKNSGDTQPPRNEKRPLRPFTGIKKNNPSELSEKRSSISTEQFELLEKPQASDVHPNVSQQSNPEVLIQDRNDYVSLECISLDAAFLTHASRNAIETMTGNLPGIRDPQLEEPGETTYEEFEKRESPLETSSMKSHGSKSSIISSLGSTPVSSPKKSPRRPRIAAKFTSPLE